MVVNTLMDNRPNLTHSSRALRLECRFCHFRNITHHKILNNRARATLRLIQGVTMTRFRAGLMKFITTVTVFFTKLLALWVMDKHRI
jgi:hypothetical protein